MSKDDASLERASEVIGAIKREFRDDEIGAIKCASIVERFFVKDKYNIFMNIAKNHLCSNCEDEK